MDDFVRAFVAFFAIIDPLGNILVFHLFTRNQGIGPRAVTAFVAIVAAFLLLLSFSLGGDAVLDFLGISQESFQIAAGLLLLPAAYRLVMEGEPFQPRESGAEMKPVDLALVPLAMPLIAGPGALAATIAFTDSLGRQPTIAAFAVVLAISFLGFVTAERLFNLVGEAILKLMARLVGIVLFAIAVDFVLDGARAFFTSG